MTMQGKKPSELFFKGEYRLLDTYLSMQSVADSAAMGNDPEYRMAICDGDDACMVMRHTPEYITRTFGFPSDITQLVKGFPRWSQQDKIRAIKYYFETGGCVDVENGALILAALSGYEEIAKFLFDKGARLYSPVRGLYKVIQSGTSKSAFNGDVTTTRQCLAVLIEHLHTVAYPVEFYGIVCDNNYERLKIFTRDPLVQDNLIQGMCSFLHKCYRWYPEHVVSYEIADPRVRLGLAREYGVHFDPVNHAVLYNDFHTTKDRLASISQALSQHSL